MNFPSKAVPQRHLSNCNKLHLADKNRSRTLILQGTDKQSVRQTHPESLAKRGEKSCDWLVEIIRKSRNRIEILEQIYVELKSRHHLSDAVEQLRKTIQRFDPELKTYQKRSYVVGTFRRPSGTMQKIEDRNFQARYKSRFMIVRGGEDCSEPLCSTAN